MLSFTPSCGLVAAAVLLFAGKLYRARSPRLQAVDENGSFNEGAAVPANLWMACVNAATIRDVHLVRYDQELNSLHVRYAGNRKWYCVAQAEAPVREALKVLQESGVSVPAV